MKSELLPRLTSMLAVWAVLLAWQLAALQIGDWAIPFFLAVLAIPISMAGAERSFYLRHAFRYQYLKEPSWLSRLISLEALVFAAAVTKALVQALLLLTFAVAINPHGWALLLMDVFILTLLMPRIPGLLSESVNPTYLYALARRMIIKFNAVLLWLELMAPMLLRDAGHYRGLSLAEALAYSMPDGQVDASGLVDGMLRLYAGVEVLPLWAIAVLRASDLEPAQGLIACLVLGAIAFLFWHFALACSQALIGSMSRPLAIWRPGDRRRPGRAGLETWWH